MADNNDNVIDLFKRAQSADSADACPAAEFLKKFPCIKLQKDNNGNYFNEKIIREYSKKVCYIVTVMRSSAPFPSLYRYKVPPASLADFLNIFKHNNSFGEIVDIEKYIPGNLA